MFTAKQNRKQGAVYACQGMGNHPGTQSIKWPEQCVQNNLTPNPTVLLHVFVEARGASPDLPFSRNHAKQLKLRIAGIRQQEKPDCIEDETPGFSCLVRCSYPFQPELGAERINAAKPDKFPGLQ